MEKISKKTYFVAGVLVPLVFLQFFLLKLSSFVFAALSVWYCFLHPLALLHRNRKTPAELYESWMREVGYFEFSDVFEKAVYVADRWMFTGDGGYVYKGVSLGDTEGFSEYRTKQQEGGELTSSSFYSSDGEENEGDVVLRNPSDVELSAQVCLQEAAVIHQKVHEKPAEPRTPEMKKPAWWSDPLVHAVTPIASSSSKKRVPVSPTASVSISDSSKPYRKRDRLFSKVSFKRAPKEVYLNEAMLEKLGAGIGEILANDDMLAYKVFNLCWFYCTTVDPNKTSVSRLLKDEEVLEITDIPDVQEAITALEPLKKQFTISRADLWTYAGIITFEALGGPKIDWNPGRPELEATHRKATFWEVCTRAELEMSQRVALWGGLRAYSIIQLEPPVQAHNGLLHTIPSYTKLSPNEKAFLDTFGEEGFLYAQSFAGDEATFFKQFCLAFGKVIDHATRKPTPGHSATSEE
ncbi:hypothetical protein FT663_02343 [Candidozyma haemuli var. vulneris]|nr:hypothetical protein FT663_02343 [[Candida] haemuloni var. vulneris]KAF3994237.1 hypothetical protein FT662_00106 [[Candida] haemuloni var. vulneris]